MSLKPGGLRTPPGVEELPNYVYSGTIRMKMVVRNRGRSCGVLALIRWSIGDSPGVCSVDLAVDGVGHPCDTIKSDNEHVHNLNLCN
jgi:hypothetical protein